MVFVKTNELRMQSFNDILYENFVDEVEQDAQQQYYRW